MPDTTAPWRLVVEFVGLDLDDDDIIYALVADPSLRIEWSSSEGVTTAEATIAAESVGEALAAVKEVVSAAAPEAAVLRLTDPLVAISDIAGEAGVTRQAVRHWALGTRHSGFPRPLATVGDGIRVWRWADIDAWLVAAVNLGSGYRFPAAAFIVDFNDDLDRHESHLDDGHDIDDGGWHVASQRSETQSALNRQSSGSHRHERPRRSSASASGAATA